MRLKPASFKLALPSSAYTTRVVGLGSAPTTCSAPPYSGEESATWGWGGDSEGSSQALTSISFSVSVTASLMPKARSWEAVGGSYQGYVGGRGESPQKRHRGRHGAGECGAMAHSNASSVPAVLCKQSPGTAPDLTPAACRHCPCRRYGRCATEPCQREASCAAHTSEGHIGTLRKTHSLVDRSTVNAESTEVRTGCGNQCTDV